MNLPHSLPSTLNLLRHAKDEEDLLILLRTRSSSQLLQFFTAMAGDETWCGSHVPSATLVLQRLTHAFLTRRLSVEQAQAIAQQIREHHATLLPLLPQDLLCLVEGRAYPISSLLLGAESGIVRAWVWNQPTQPIQTTQHIPTLKLDQKQFALGDMPLHTFRCLEEYLTQGSSHTLALSSLAQMQRHIHDCVIWELNTFRQVCMEALSFKLHVEEMEPFLALAMRFSLQDLAELCCTIWNRWNDFDSGVELQAQTPKELSFRVHAFHLSQWPHLVRHAKWVTRLIFCGSTASHLLAKDLAALCKNVTSYDLTQTESCDDALMESFFSAQELRLASCPWLDNDHVEQLFSHTKQLKILDLSNNPQITKQAWNRLKYIKTIRTLRLTYYHTSQEKELVLILLLLASKATDIDLSWSSGVSDETMEIFTKQNKGISILRLSHCENITDATLRICQERLHDVHLLDLSGNVQLSEEAIETCTLTMASLRTLDVRRCEMSPMTLAHIREKPNMTIMF